MRSVKLHRIVHEAVLPYPSLPAELQRIPTEPQRISADPQSMQVLALRMGDGQVKEVRFGDDDVFLILHATKGKIAQLIATTRAI